MDEMIQLIGIVGPVKNYVDSSKGIHFSVDRKYKKELHQVDDLFQTEVIIQIIPRAQAEAMLKKAGQNPEPVEECMPDNVEYDTPEKIEQLNKLRQNIHLELMNAGMDTRKEEIIMALVNQKRERDCTIEELTKVWQFITQDGYPIQNSTNLRNRLMNLIEGGATCL